MARCCGTGCGCKVEPGPGIDIEGLGLPSNPFVVSTTNPVPTPPEEGSFVLHSVDGVLTWVAL